MCAHIHPWTHTYMKKYTNTHVQMHHIGMHTHTNACAYIYMFMHTRTNTHTRTYTPNSHLLSSQRPISFPSSTATHLLLMKFTFFPHRAIGERETGNCGNILSLLFGSPWPLDRSMTRNKRLYPNSMRIDMPLKELSAWLLWAVL